MGVRTDRDRILIGERISFQLLVELPGPAGSVRFSLPDSIPHFDIIEEKKFDTLRAGEGFVLRKEIILTSFDSGSQIFPSLPVEIGLPKGMSVLNTKTIPIEVGYSPADSSGQLRDIKPIMGVEVRDYFWLYVLAVAVGILILSFLIYRYIQSRGRKPRQVFESRIPAYEEAIKSLDELQWQAADRQKVVAYYDKLSVIFKRFYSREKNADLLSATTGDMLIRVKKQNGTEDVIPVLADALRGADAVKFARFIPDEALAAEHKAKIRQAIQSLHQLKQKSIS